MTPTLPQQEPDAAGQPLRAYTDPAYRPLCDTLAQVRANIDRLDEDIVRCLAERAMYVKDAARFKADAHQVSAPARQAEVFARVQALAARHDPGFDHFDDVVQATYRSMVAAFIAHEQTYFTQMKPVGDNHD